MVCDRCNCYFTFWAIFCPFTLLTAQKNQIKHLEISLFYTCIKNYNHMMHGSLDMVCDRQTDRQTEKVTYKGGVSPKYSLLQQVLDGIQNFNRFLCCDNV